MANRTYLYVVNDKFNKIGDASEYPYGIPLSYKILLSEEVELRESMIFGTTDPIAYVGSFEKGMKKYHAFLEYLKTLPETDVESIEAYQASTKAFFENDRKGNWTYFLLEPGEIFDLTYDVDPLIEQGQYLFKEIRTLSSELDTILEEKPMDFLTQETTKAWICELQRDIKAIEPYWSRVCYYSFNKTLKE